MRNSDTDPLQIAAVDLPDRPGTIGMTFCPGKNDPNAATGAWDRDLETDIAAIEHWGAEIVVTLMEAHELRLLNVERLPMITARHGMRWVHLPIRDISIPDQRFEDRWVEENPAAVLQRGGKILVHCRGGLGRTGMIAARLLVEFGLDPAEAIRRVRAARPGAIETPEQAAYVHRCKSLQ